ncbi:GIY-YIG nuclease family protein [Sphingobacterium faecale]|uniref:GIY-YIG nuclease family protein n=1 Tax=Sphingobacterium faecale TaxID=2803775 RepID=A0ABS1R9F5_9SPHI|nr:GIY-YIG nuclease family protein [Sphingobacterium faecale]MBL1411308.1 GIY-YIG nuclease family protein [Sphingobacterium faecale]
MERGGVIYMLTNVNRTVLYIGVTSDLYTRLVEHREKRYANSFTSQYNSCLCVYYESFSTIEEAIDREKQLKKWNRAKKEILINKLNPQWNDLWEVVKEW